MAKKNNLEQKATNSKRIISLFRTRETNRLKQLHKKNKSILQKLSEREIDVLKLICEEHTNQVIADKLFISKRTVEGHRQRILVKVGAKNTVGLVLYAMANEIYIFSPSLRLL
jgi:DNA-binding NarL/FixJ family response regulator